MGPAGTRDVPLFPDSQLFLLLSSAVCVKLKLLLAEAAS